MNLEWKKRWIHRAVGQTATTWKTDWTQPVHHLYDNLHKHEATAQASPEERHNLRCRRAGQQHLPFSSAFVPFLSLQTKVGLINVRVLLRLSHHIELGEGLVVAMWRISSDVVFGFPVILQLSNLRYRTWCAVFGVNHWGSAKKH